MYTGVEQSFRRNIDSGSFFGGSNKRRVDTHDLDKASFGDLVCPINFRFCIECKHYKNPPVFSAVMKQNIADWDKWMTQATEDGLSANREPAVIVKYNNVEELVILSRLPDNLGYAVKYRDYYVTTLSDFLSLDDSTFFLNREVNHQSL
jgi:hypothetical protein